MQVKPIKQNSFARFINKSGKIFILAIVSLTAFGANGAARSQPAEELRQLDKALERAPHYAAQHEVMLDSMKALTAAAVRRGDMRGAWQHDIDLARAYRSFNTDSALLYSARAEQRAMLTGDTMNVVMSKISRIASLSTAGLFADARTLLDSLANCRMTPEARIAYWKSARLLYGYQGVYVDGDEYFAQRYRERYLAYDDSLQKHMKADDPFRRFIVCERQVAEGKYDSARKGLESLLRELDENSNLYGMVCFQMAEVARHKRDESGYAMWLAKAAESDIKSNVREGLALPTLALWLYEEGNLNEAFSYINFALEDATRGNARMRTVAIGKLVPVIDEAYREKISASRDQLMVYLLMVFVLLVVSVGLLVVLRRQIVSARASRRKLAATAHLQDTYMAHFIGLCSGYADRLESLTRLVTRKVSAGETDELKKMIKAGKFSTEGEDSFRVMFDKAFLDIYPDFPDQVNALLRPEERIEIKDGLMTTDLRIYALVRLGVDDSQRIAQILHCSVNTVYSYRNRMRNRAVEREGFDEAIKSIGSSDEE